MALEIKEIGKARNLVGPTSAYAVRRMRTHASISERTLLSANALFYRQTHLILKAYF